MAASPQFKIYDCHGDYQAAVKEPEAGACLMGLYGDGATIRYSHTWILWTEGSEEIQAGESYDRVAITVYERLHARQQAAYDKVHGKTLS